MLFTWPARRAGFEPGGASKRLHVALPVNQWVPTGTGQGHQLQVVDSERLKSPTHSVDRTAVTCCVAASVHLAFRAARNCFSSASISGDPGFRADNASSSRSASSRAPACAYRIPRARCDAGNRPSDATVAASRTANCAGGSGGRGATVSVRPAVAATCRYTGAHAQVEARPSTRSLVTADCCWRRRSFGPALSRCRYKMRQRRGRRAIVEHRRANRSEHPERDSVRIAQQRAARARQVGQH